MCRISSFQLGGYANDLRDVLRFVYGTCYLDLGPYVVSQRGLLLNSSVCFRAKRTDWLGIHGLCATKAIPDLPDNILVKNPEPESQHQLEQLILQ